MFLVLTLLINIGCNSIPKTGNPAVEKTPRTKTDRTLDLAINGDGYFIVQLPSTGGFLFTRAGSLSVASSGELVNVDGYRLYPPVTVGDATNIVITPDGVVRAAHGEGSGDVAGQVVLSSFKNQSGLIRDGVYVMPGESTDAPVTGRPGTKGLGVIVVGELEK